MKTRLRVAALLCSAAAIAACGEDSETPDAAQPPAGNAELQAVVQRLTTFSRAGEGGRICEELFTENLRLSVRRASGRRCGEEVRANVFKENASYTLQDVAVNGDQATAVLVDEQGVRSQVLFERVDGQWRIARIGPA